MKSLYRIFHAASSARCLTLDFFWLAGLCFGGSLHFFCPSFPSPEAFFTEGTSILIAIIPFFFWPTASILIASIFPKHVLLCVAFMRGMVFIFVWCMLWEMLQPLGWFLSSGFMVAELLLNPLLFLLWKHLMTNTTKSPLFFVFYMVAVLLVSFLYVQWVIPISVFLIKDLFQEILS